MTTTGYWYLPNSGAHDPFAGHDIPPYLEGGIEIACACGETECVCGVGEALIGPASIAGDGTIPLYWSHSEPSSFLDAMIAQFGTPSVLDTSPGGCAVLKAYLLTGTPFSEVVLKDQEILHCCPMPHNDYLYTSVCVDLTPKVQQDMLAITESVWYDRLAHVLTARCHFM